MSDHGHGSQQSPIPNDRPSAHDLVIAAVEERKAFGLRKYGTHLQAGNGRDHLQDAFEEALDLVAYLAAAIAERDGFSSCGRGVCAGTLGHPGKCEEDRRDG